jgi:hypothetical protein
VDTAPAVGTSGFATIFYASALLRLLAALAMWRFVREVRAVRRVDFRDVVLDFFGQRIVQVRAAPGEEARAARRDRGQQR